MVNSVDFCFLFSCFICGLCVFGSAVCLLVNYGLVVVLIWLRCGCAALSVCLVVWYVSCSTLCVLLVLL